ncbi:alpha/beta-hydrolase [Hyaloscypha bicolor E]|uniref:Alpha/beta-hydrolase n=1 Tax=Hyaloscypha bicolor E TaxID=1095630 RepID=A0A2J6TX41_9HELO|nr:alpha/beta-hydrolase [Hyaloscypha bicolor E]PMD67602.1 alpha/beta-hydrolase [Hyaloscypha bicolor E]
MSLSQDTVRSAPAYPFVRFFICFVPQVVSEIPYGKLSYAIPYSRILATATKQPSPFLISIPEAKLADFKTLLKLSKVTPQTYESLQEDRRFGVDHKWVTETKKYWEETFDYFLEFLPILSLLKGKYTPQDLPYHIIVPPPRATAYPLPPLDRDNSMDGVAEIVNQLMLALGFGSRYITQGGHIGSRVAKIVAWKYELCKAVHVNYFPVLSPPEGLPVSSLNAKEQDGLKWGEDFVKMEPDYSLERAARPSPFLAWSDEDPEFEKVLESVTFCWLTETFPTSVYPYRGVRHLPFLNTGPLFFADEGRRIRYLPNFDMPRFLEKPLGHSYFPKGITPTAKSWVKTQANNVFYREHEKVRGHFPALEQPRLLMGDIEEYEDHGIK